MKLNLKCKAGISWFIFMSIVWVFLGVILLLHFTRIFPDDKEKLHKLRPKLEFPNGELYEVAKYKVKRKKMWNIPTIFFNVDKKSIEYVIPKSNS